MIKRQCINRLLNNYPEAARYYSTPPFPIFYPFLPETPNPFTRRFTSLPP